MKIDFIEKYNPNYPNDSIFRIYEFDSAEATSLQNIFAELNEGKIKEFELEKLPFVHSVDGSSLILRCTTQDEGIAQSSSKRFVCKLTKNGWGKAKDLIQPFCKPNIHNGFQWLYDINTNIDLLLSINGNW
jgi:hypothetical protein